MGRSFLPRPACKQCGKSCKWRRCTYCSYACRAEAETGKAKPYMIGNKFAYRAKDVTIWAEYKRMQALVPSGPCSRCGSNKQSIIHHEDHDPHNTVPENLIRLCRACHASHHHSPKEKMNAYCPVA